MENQINSLLDNLSPKKYILNMNNQYTFLNKRPKRQNRSLNHYNPKYNINPIYNQNYSDPYYSNSNSYGSSQVLLPKISKKDNRRKITQIKKQISYLKNIIQQQARQKALQNQINQKINQFVMLGRMQSMNHFQPFNMNHCSHSNHCVKCQQSQQYLPQKPQRKNIDPPMQNNKPQRKSVPIERNYQQLQPQPQFQPVPRTPIKKYLPKVPKMRKYVIAVYFAMYFPNFAENFTRNRYRHFKQHYLKTDGFPVIECSSIVKKTLLKNIDIPKLILDYKSIKLQQLNAKSEKNPHKKGAILQHNKNIPEAQNKKNTPKSKINKIKFQQIDIKDNFIDNVVFFMNSLMAQIYPILTNKKFLVKIYPLLSAGILNCSFLMDNLLMNPQLKLLKYHFIKGYMIATAQKQKVLLMNLLITKILIGNVLLNPQGKSLWTTAGQVGQTQWENIYQVIDAGATILYIFAKQIFDQFVQKLKYSSSVSPFIQSLSDTLTKCSYQELKSRFKVKPANSVNVEKDSATRKQLNKKIYQDFIVGIPHLEQISKITIYDKKIQSVKTQIKSKIVSLIQEIHQKIHNDSHLAFYDQIKAITLGQKNMITKGDPKWIISKRAQNYHSNYNYQQFFAANNQLSESKIIGSRILTEEADANMKQSNSILSRISQANSFFNPKINIGESRKNAKESGFNLPVIPSLTTMRDPRRQTNIKKDKENQNINSQPNRNLILPITSNRTQNQSSLPMSTFKQAPNKFTTFKSNHNVNSGSNQISKYEQILKRMQKSKHQVHH